MSDLQLTGIVATAPVPRVSAPLYDGQVQRVGGSLTHTAEAFALRPDAAMLSSAG